MIIAYMSSFWINKQYRFNNIQIVINSGNEVKYCIDLTVLQATFKKIILKHCQFSNSLTVRYAYAAIFSLSLISN